MPDLARVAEPPPVAVLIPSHKRTEKLRVCLAGLARQTRPPAAVLVVLDGGDAEAALQLEKDFRETLNVDVEATSHNGYIPARRRLLASCQEPIALSLNDDVLPAPTLVEAHAEAHARGGNQPALVTGPSPFAPPDVDASPPPSLFDSLVCETDLIFFGPARDGPPPDAALGYRDCVGLNFSVPTDVARAAGGFHDLPHTYGYDDIELAHRVIRSAHGRVMFEPAASVVHDHRYTPEAVLQREYALGRAAWAYAGLNPSFTSDLFGRDIRDPRETEHANAVLERDRHDAARIERSFRQLADLPPDAVRDTRLLRVLAEQWLLLKRYLWRWGLRDAAASQPPSWSTLADTPKLP